MRKIVTIVGSRETPRKACDALTYTASAFERSGWLIRTGDADGADKSARNGVKDPCNIEVFTPDDYISDLVFEIASQVHPVWSRIKSEKAKRLIARNTFQVLGRNLDIHTDVVLCWTQDGTECETTALTSGTGQAIRLAVRYDIPVYNLNKYGDTKKSYDYFYGVVKSLIEGN